MNAEEISSGCVLGILTAREIHDGMNANLNESLVMSFLRALKKSAKIWRLHLWSFFFNV